MTNNFSVKIALVDDEPFMLKLLGRMLENLGRWLTVTCSGRRG